MKSWKQILLIAMVSLTVLSLLLSACEPIDRSHGNANPTQEKEKQKGKDTEEGKGGLDKVTICHKTGSAKHPYVEIRVPDDAVKDGHAAHEGDLIPAPETGCPAKAIATEAPTK